MVFVGGDAPRSVSGKRAHAGTGQPGDPKRSGPRQSGGRPRQGRAQLSSSKKGEWREQVCYRPVGSEADSGTTDELVVTDEQGFGKRELAPGLRSLDLLTTSLALVVASRRPGQQHAT